MCVQVGGQMVGDGKMGVKEALSGLKIPIQQGTMKGVASLSPQLMFQWLLTLLFLFLLQLFFIPLDNTAEWWGVQWETCLFSCPS